MAQVCSKYFLLFSLYNLLFARLTVTECSTTSAPAYAATWCAVTSSPAVSTSRQSTSSSTLTSPRWLRHTCTGSAAAEGEQSSQWHCYEHISWEVKRPMFSTLESVCQITSLHLRILEKWCLWSFINFETFVRENLKLFCSFSWVEFHAHISFPGSATLVSPSTWSPTMTDSPSTESSKSWARRSNPSPGTSTSPSTWPSSTKRRSRSNLLRRTLQISVIYGTIIN